MPIIQTQRPGGSVLGDLGGGIADMLMSYYNSQDEDAQKGIKKDNASPGAAYRPLMTPVTGPITRGQMTPIAPAPATAQMPDLSNILGMLFG